MEELRSEIDIVGIPSDKPFTLREAKRSFRRRSHQLLPEKSLGAQNAHSRFEELNTAFLKLLHYFHDSHGENISELAPGEIDVKRNIFVITLRKGSVPHWKRVIKAVYPTVIIGAQKKLNFIPGAQGKGIRYVVYWKAGLEGSSGQIKVNLVLYENELLQVSGSGYFLWTMDNYQDVSRRVDESMSDAQRSDDEGVATEEFSESRGSSDIKEEPEEAECPLTRCPDTTCLASNKFETILKYLGDIDEDLTSKCSDLKTYIEDLESEFSRQLQELSRTLDNNDTKYNEDFKITQAKIASINEKVVETKQIIAGASGGSSKISKATNGAVGVEKVKQKLVNGSLPKKTRKKSGATEAASRRVSKKHDGEEEPGAGARGKPLSRSSSPRKGPERASSRPSRSRSNSPRKPRSEETLSVSGSNVKSGSRSRHSSMLNNGHRGAENNEEEDEDDYDEETNGSSVSIDV